MELSKKAKSGQRRRSDSVRSEADAESDRYIFPSERKI